MWFVPSDYETLGIDKKRDIKENKSFPILRLFQGLDMGFSGRTYKRRNNATPWSKSDIQKLIELYPHRHNYQLAGIFGRTVSGIMGMAIRLGLKKRYDDEFKPPGAFEQPSWSDEEIRILKEMYPLHTAEEISDSIDRTASAIIARAQRLRLKKNWLWPKQDEDYLRKFHNKKSYAELGRILGKTTSAITKRAIDLGISYKASPPWTTRQVKLLIEYYPIMKAKKLAKLIGRTSRAVNTKALELGIRSYPEDRKWNKQEDETLRKYYKKMPREDLAVKLGRTSNAVKLRAVALGLTGRNIWKKKVIAVLKKKFRKGASVKKIAKLLGKSERTCYYKIEALGLINPGRNIWESKDIAVLKREFGKGASISQIANLLGKNRYACYRKIKTLGLRRS